jgi:DNA polymerase-3 subunit beta
MKFTVEKSDLLKSAKNVERGVPSGVAPLPVLHCIRMDLDDSANVLTLKGTDLSFGVETKLKVRATSGGSICVNAKLFTQIVNSLGDGAITVEVVDNNKKMKISSGRSNFEMRTVAVNEYPAGQKFNEDDEFSVDSKSFLNGISKVVSAASSDQSRQVLCGVNVTARTEEDTVSFAATDSYRLAVVDVAGLGASFGADTQVTIPSKALDELVRSVDPGKNATISVTISSTAAQFRVGDTTFFTRLIEGTYPTYEKLLSVEEKYTAKLDTEEMIGTLKRVQIMNDASAVIPARFDFSDSELRVSCSKTDVGVADERLDVHLTPLEEGDEGDTVEDFSIGFNPKYMVDGLNAFGGEDVVLHINNELKPVLVTSEKVPDLRYILMPVRL